MSLYKITSKKDFLVKYVFYSMIVLIIGSLTILTSLISGKMGLILMSFALLPIFVIILLNKNYFVECYDLAYWQKTRFAAACCVVADMFLLGVVAYVH